MSFITKDSGKRKEFASGMKRDVDDDKPRYDLCDSTLLVDWIYHENIPILKKAAFVSFSIWADGKIPAYIVCQAIVKAEGVTWKEFADRWSELKKRGALKYGEHNWKKASGEEELNRFMASAWRHMIQWLNGETDEDHAAAVFYNIGGYEYVKRKLDQQKLVEQIKNNLYEDSGFRRGRDSKEPGWLSKRWPGFGSYVVR